MSACFNTCAIQESPGKARCDLVVAQYLHLTCMMADAGCDVKEATGQCHAMDIDLPAEQQPEDAVQHRVLITIPKNTDIPV